MRQRHFRRGVVSDAGRNDCHFLGTRSVVQIDELPGEVGREPHDVRWVESSVTDILAVKIFQCLKYLRHPAEHYGPASNAWGGRPSRGSRAVPWGSDVWQTSDPKANSCLFPKRDREGDRLPRRRRSTTWEMPQAHRMACEGQALLADVFALVGEAVDSDRVHPFVRISDVESQHHALRRH